jgi:hypothetical protein
MKLVGSDTPAVLVAHLGYDARASKRALVATASSAVPSAVHLIRADGWTRELHPERAETVAGWSTTAYHPVRFDDVAEAGEYRVEAIIQNEAVSSVAFRIGEHALQEAAVADITAYFRSMRSSGEIDRKDAHARFYGDDSGREVDAHGGWLDASGDYSKFLSHLTYTRMMSPQQTPLVAWAFAQAAAELPAVHPGFETSQHARLRDEALHGADFLMRFRSPEGYFYTGIFDALTKDLQERVITAPLQDSVRTQRWQAAYRHGGGMAIAALARAATLDASGDFGPGEYWAAAERGFEHLEKHNAEYLFDGQESIIDDYCALMAATELIRAGRLRGADVEPFEQAARTRVAGLSSRLESDHLVGDVTGAPFFHAAEPGLPIIALILAAEQLPDAAERARGLARTLLAALVRRTDAVANPFGYPRQRVRPIGGEPRDAFFYPHENETGYWWQGENAGLGSFAYAATLGARLDEVDPALRERLLRLADDSLGWIGGLNPFDSCMLQGKGRNNPDYSLIFQNSPGGIANGITSGFYDEDGIALLPEDAPDRNQWRWGEQWIPHSGWFVLAVCAAR